MTWYSGGWAGVAGVMVVVSGVVQWAQGLEEHDGVSGVAGVVVVVSGVVWWSLGLHRQSRCRWVQG